MSCFPFPGSFNKKINKDKQECEDLAKTKSKYLSQKKIKESIENLPKQDVFDNIYHWLENNENKAENSTYDEQSNASSSNGSEEEYHVSMKIRKSMDVHPINIQEEYLQGCLMQQKHVQNCIKVYHNKLWIPPTTLV